MPEKWLFSPWRLRGHRERLGLPRHALAARMGMRQDTIKAYEYGSIRPSLPGFLSLADSLGISPNDLCRMCDNDDLEYLAAKTWTPSQPQPSRTPWT